MHIYLERPSACRLYSLLGQNLYLHSIAKADLTDEEKLQALNIWAKNLEQEVGLKRLNSMQNEVYCALTVDNRQAQEQTNALRRSA